MREAAAAVNWADPGFGGDQTVRDLWRQKDGGKLTGQFEAKFDRHGGVLAEMSPVRQLLETCK